jgi:hypothetical protein
LHVPSHDESELAPHFCLQVVLHSPPQVSLQSLVFKAPAQRVAQSSEHLFKQLPLHSMSAFALHPIEQSASQLSRQVPVASALHWPSHAAPSVASQTASKSMSEQRSGQSTFAVM